MKNIFEKFAVLGVALLLPLSALAESAIPTLPVAYYGDVTINGATAPAGTLVKAEYSGAEVGIDTLEEAGKYQISISEDEVPVGATIKFFVNGQEVSVQAGTFKMLSFQIAPTAEYDLAVGSGNSNGGGGSSNGNPGGTNGGSVTVATSATPANTSTTPATPAIPATPASPASDANGQVKGVTAVNVVDGDIIQCRNSADPFAVYIVKEVNGKKYIRHIVSLQIFNHYKHLKWENLIQVESLDGFNLAGWVRVNTGANGQAGPNDRVYEINGDQTRHWIDMTAAEFLLHGGSDEAIFSINAGELSLYREGPAVKLH